MRCRQCHTVQYHEEKHQKSTTLRFTAAGGMTNALIRDVCIKLDMYCKGWSRSVNRQRDGCFHCLCGEFGCRRPDEIRHHASSCRDVPDHLRPSTRRSQRIARRNAAAPYVPRTPSPQQAQSGSSPAEATSTGSSHQQQQQAGTPPAQSSGSVSSQQQQQQQSTPTPPSSSASETSRPVSSQPPPSAETSGSSTTSSQQPQQEEWFSSAEASGSNTTSQQQQQEEALSYDGDGELSSHGSFDTAYEGEAVPTPPLHTPPPQAPPLTEEAQAEVARIREMLVQLITSHYRRVDDLPEADVMITFDVRLEGLRTPALRSTLDVTRHGANVDTLARMIHGIVDGVPGGTLQNLRIHYYPSHCIVI